MKRLKKCELRARGTVCEQQRASAKREARTREQRANYERELTHELRDAPVCGGPREGKGVVGPPPSPSPRRPGPGRPLWWPFFPLFYILLLSSSSDISYHQLNQQDGLQPPSLVTQTLSPHPLPPTSSPRGSTRRASSREGEEEDAEARGGGGWGGSMGGGFSSRCSFTHSRLYLSGRARPSRSRRSCPWRSPRRATSSARSPRGR